MTWLEIERAKELGFQKMRTPFGDALYRRDGDRLMTVVHIKSGTEVQEDLEQEPRIEPPSTRAWVELLIEGIVDEINT